MHRTSISSISAIATLLLALSCGPVYAQQSKLLALDRPASAADFPLVADGHATAIYVAPGSSDTVTAVAEAFASDVERVNGVRPQLLTSLAKPLPPNLILVGTLGHAPEIEKLAATRTAAAAISGGKWEAAVTAVVNAPMPGVKRALVVLGSDRRGTAYALLTLSREMGVSPWTWWADVAVAHHAAVYVRAGVHVQASPSVQYRGIFLNDEDWGLRPWAAKKMDPTIDGGKGNIGPRTYERIFELLLRLHANSLWPAMHPDSLPFNAVPENARLADKWGIVMGSSHSEALLRNNVGEWNEAAPPAGDGPWNYQKNAVAMNAYWDKRLEENGRYENFYTVGLRGVHDSGLEATGTAQVKAKLVEQAMGEQRRLLAARVNSDVMKIPQVMWLYKESLDLYRAGMQIPADVTLGWTDDNYGYLRELPNAAEQARPGGSGVYYHVSYWGAPHDYLWLCTTPPALIQEEMTKAYDHNARRYWILNVGDLKPAEIDIDYFMQLATDETTMAKVSQREFLRRWAGENFPGAEAAPIADLMTRYYALNFIRRPEFMGFNGYNDTVKRTAFNPLAWHQNDARMGEWASLLRDERAIVAKLPRANANVFFELVEYPIEAAAAMNTKFLATDLTYLDAHDHDAGALAMETGRAQQASRAIESLTAKYNALEGGKWDGIMSAAPRERHVFEMPRTATIADTDDPLPVSWNAGSDACNSAAREAAGPGFTERHCTVSINAAHFVRSYDAELSSSLGGWRILHDLGISGDSVEYGSPGLLANRGMPEDKTKNSTWLEYDFATSTAGAATLTLHLLPTFAVDSSQRLRYAVAVDGGAPLERDGAAGAATHGAGSGDGPAGADWPQNVLRNSAVDTIALGRLAPGRHTVRLMYRDPGVVFEHLVITFPGAPPAYPVPPETK